MAQRVTQRAASQGVDWWVMRIAVSEHFATEPHAVRCDWAFADQLEAHIALDALDEIRAIYRPDPPKER